MDKEGRVDLKFIPRSVAHRAQPLAFCMSQTEEWANKTLTDIAWEHRQHILTDTTEEKKCLEATKFHAFYDGLTPAQQASLKPYYEIREKEIFPQIEKIDALAERIEANLSKPTNYVH